MTDKKAACFKAGKAWTAKYLYRIPYTKTDKLKATPPTISNDNTNYDQDYFNGQIDIDK